MAKKCFKLFIISLIVFGLNGTSFADLTDGMVAYFPFNGDASDQSGNGNNGTVYGPVLTVDRFGSQDNAYLFDGYDDYISADHSDSLNITESITLSVWIKADPGQEDYAGILNKITSNSPRPGYNLNFNDNHNIQGSVYYDWPQGVLGRGTSIRQLDDSTWHHIVYVYDYGEGNNLAIYIDGKNDCNTCTQGYSYGIASNNEPLRIGLDPGYTMYDRIFKGSIDDIRIYNRALSECEVQELFILELNE